MIGDFKNQIDIFPPMAYYNSNRTPHTSHASDVSHGETFFIRKRVNLILKEPKIFEEQLTLIRGKGFIIPEGKEQDCIEFLQKTNYYRLSAYFLPFRKKDGTFFPNIKLSRIQRSNFHEITSICLIIQHIAIKYHTINQKI